MSKHDSGGPAFPEVGERGKAASGEGMSLRDYFAAKALQGVATEIAEWNGSGWEQDMARVAYQLADAMLAARQEGQS